MTYRGSRNAPPVRLRMFLASGRRIRLGMAIRRRCQPIVVSADAHDLVPGLGDLYVLTIKITLGYETVWIEEAKQYSTDAGVNTSRRRHSRPFGSKKPSLLTVIHC